MTGQEIMHVIDQIGREKGLNKDIIIEAIKAAVVSAAKKRYSSQDSLEVELDSKTGKISIYAIKTVAQEVLNPSAEINLEEARELGPDVKIGDQVNIPLETEDFGRIAAQTAKQVIVQRVREAERKRIYDEYHDKLGELVNGIVMRQEKGNIIVDLGKAEGILPRREQAYRENFRRGDRIRAYVLEVKNSSKGPQIILSRTHPDMLVKLFELEVPEISENIVEIKSAAREPSGRSKIAVLSHDSEVDAVGACVGMRGSRVQAIVQELRGEKIDIIEWTDDPVAFVRNALSPAEVRKIIVHEEDHSMEVIVEDSQLSLAIGKKGQNVRLATKLTQWKIDIRSYSEYEKDAVSEAPEAEEAKGAVEDYKAEEELKRAEEASPSAQSQIGQSPDGEEFPAPENDDRGEEQERREE